MFIDIGVEELLALRAKQEIELVDVRSPAEYADGTIPGSLNIPFFDNEERAEVGTLYTRVSVQAAKTRGLELASAKLPALVQAFAQLERRPAVFCWRGGMRSHTTATVLSLMGIRVYRLTGGVRAYRTWVVQRLEASPLPNASFVLAGNTGNGKTAILRQLQQEGYPVLDLEGLAGHRGSIFGHVGLSPHNQKTFDALLVDRLQQLEQAPYLIMEAESNRIGKVVLPPGLAAAKDSGVQLFIELPLDVRVRQIMEDYKPAEYQEELLQSYQRIKGRIHTPIAKEIEGYLRSGSFEEAVALLLTHYYDSRYEYALQAGDKRRVKLAAASIPEAVTSVKAYLSTLHL